MENKITVESTVEDFDVVSFEQALKELQTSE